MKLKTNAFTEWNSETGEDFWYSISNGYIILEDVLNKRDAAAVRDAVELLNTFKELLLDAELRMEEE